MVRGPGVASRRMASSLSRVIFMHAVGCKVCTGAARPAAAAPPSAGRRLLLGEAVQRAEAPYEIHRVDSDDCRSGKSSAIVLRATRSLRSLKVGTSTTPFAM